MLPLIPFALGLLTGVAAIRMLKSDPARAGFDKARAGLDKAKAGLGSAQDHLRDAAVSGLTAIEHSSARLRSRLAEDAEPAAPEAAAAPPPETPAATQAPTAAAKPTPRRRAASKKRAAATGGETGQAS